MFSKEEQLAMDQITTYVSKLSVMYRSGRLAIDQADLSPAQGEAEDILTRLAVRRLYYLCHRATLTSTM